MTDKSLAIAENNQPSVFGAYQDIARMSRRLSMMTLPGGKRLQPEERMALAQLAIAHELDPFNGEIWLIPNAGPMIGIKGLRKKARQQLNHGKDGNFWTNFVELKPEDKTRLKIPADSLAFECRLFDTETINIYVATIKQLKDAGMPWEIITGIVGDRPYTSGYGFFKAGEQSRMTAIQCAMKRAEADAIKRRFDVPFGITAADDQAGEVYEGEWQDAVASEKPETPSKEQRAKDNAALFGEETPDAPLPVDVGPDFDAPEAAPAETNAQQPTAAQNKDNDSPRARLWSAWLRMSAEAKALGVYAKELPETAPTVDISAALNSLGKAIKKAKE